MNCVAMGTPNWWSDYREFVCELPDGHPGPHRQTIEWTDLPFITPAELAQGIREWQDNAPTGKDET